MAILYSASRFQAVVKRKLLPADELIRLVPLSCDQDGVAGT
jgi:hypothetical protein